MGLQFLAAAAAMATVFTFLASFVFWWIQRRSMMLTRTYELYRFYYGAEHYEKLHAPTQRVIFKWYNLPDGERETYRKEVIAFWSDFHGNSEGLTRFTDENERSGDHLSHFYKVYHGEKGLTEAHAVDCVVHFWSGLYELIEEGMIEPKSARRLFRVPFSWRNQFFSDLGNAVRDTIKPGSPEPDWIANTEKLGTFLQGR